MLITLPFQQDPLSYTSSDFLIDALPLRPIYMTTHSFFGEVSPLLEKDEHILSIYNRTENKRYKIPLFIPEVLVNGFSQLENSVFFNTKGQMICLDIEKIDSSEPSYIPVLITYEPETKTVSQSYILKDKSINAIFVDEKDRIFASSVAEKSLFEIQENFKLSAYARGLGAPFGMVTNKHGELFMADQKGSLFKIENHRATFLTDIPSSVKGYYLCVHPKTQDIFISTPSYLGKNTIMFYEYKTKKLRPWRETYSLLGAIAFDQREYFYWVENKREESMVYRQYKKKKPESILSGRFFTGLTFYKGDLYINDLHTVYKISEDKLYDK